MTNEQILQLAESVWRRKHSEGLWPAFLDALRAFIPE